MARKTKGEATKDKIDSALDQALAARRSPRAILPP